VERSRRERRENEEADGILDLSPGLQECRPGACSVMFAFSAAAHDALRNTINVPAFSF